MKKILLLFLPVYLIGVPLFFYFQSSNSASVGAPPYKVTDKKIEFDIDNISSYVNWTRPEGPVKVGLQAGHWKTEQAPDEMERLRDNTGASGGGKSEYEVNLKIAEETAILLQEEGVEVEILPTTIPPDYFADVFISIHADGNTDTSKSGFKAAAPRRDTSGKAEKLLSFVESSYLEKTNLSIDPNVTRNMTGYYAFRWWRFEHTIHPMTPAIILETGFLSNPQDRGIIVDQPKIVAEGISNGVIDFLNSENLLDS